MPEQGVYVEGLTQVIRSFRRIDRGVARELSREVRTLARIVAVEARHVAAEKGLAAPGTTGRGTGELVKHIKSGYQRGYGYVKDDVVSVSPAYPQGYNYARRMEYAGKGRRSFLRPAVERSHPAILAGLDDVAEHVVREAGLIMQKH